MINELKWVAKRTLCGFVALLAGFVLFFICWIARTVVALDLWAMGSHFFAFALDAMYWISIILSVFVASVVYRKMVAR